MITLDGAQGEGGGQILRTALSLSVMTQKPFSIENIRKNRPTPGLKAQHLTGIKALQEISGAVFSGAGIGSENLEFYPRHINSFRATIDVGTAGPITLVLQSIMLPLMFAEKESRIKIVGGTDVAWSPPIDYFNQVILPQFNKYADIRIKVEKRGYYPKGCGKVDLYVKPKYKLAEYSSFEEFEKEISKTPFDLTLQGNLLRIRGVSHASKDLISSEVASRQARAARILLSGFGVPVDIREEYVDSESTGSGITLWAEFSKKDELSKKDPIIIGADALGQKGKRSEEVGQEAAKKLVDEIKSGAPIDSHLADNLIPLLAITGGRIKTSRITGHILSNIYVAESFLNVKFEVDEKTSEITAVSRTDPYEEGEGS